MNRDKIEERIRAARRAKGQQFGDIVADTILAGKIVKGMRLVPFQHGGFARATLGPRVCRVEVNAGLYSKKLLGGLDSAILPHLVPWDITDGRPVAYANGRYVAIEAAWERWLQKSDVLLSDIDTGRDSSRFIVGPNEQGTVITLYLPDLVHLLFGGASGSGKSWTMRSTAYQLAGPSNRLILLDGKDGEGLFIVNGLEGQVGPIAWDRQNIINALGWAVLEMRRRYAAVRSRGGLKFNEGDRDCPPRLIILFDEFQEFRNDRAVVEAMRILATQGRGAMIHLFLGTQRPLQEMFGASTTRGQIGSAIGGRVREYETSEAIMGGNYPRCDLLLPKGDAFVKAAVQGGELIERVQVAYVPERDLKDAAQYQPDFAVWPTFDEAELDTVEHKPRGRRPAQFTPQELAVGMVAALTDHGAPWIRDTIAEIPGHRRPGNSKTERMMVFCQEICEQMDKTGRGAGGTISLPSPPSPNC